MPCYTLSPRTPLSPSLRILFLRLTPEPYPRQTIYHASDVIFADFLRLLSAQMASDDTLHAALRSFLTPLTIRLRAGPAAACPAHPRRLWTLVLLSYVLSTCLALASHFRLRTAGHEACADPGCWCASRNRLTATLHLPGASSYGHCTTLGNKDGFLFFFTLYPVHPPSSRRPYTSAHSFHPPPRAQTSLTRFPCNLI
ncbi:hypothetical protein SCY_0015, partial [Saccharomyces cerevisiae YJM789]